MQRVLLGIDRFSTAIGHVFAWSIVALTAQVTYEVTARYVFTAPTAWGYDVSYMLYGLLFMMGGAYALARNGHVRGDFLYRKWSVRQQGAVEFVLYFVFFFPGVFALVYAGWTFFTQSYAQNERSPFSPSSPVIWPFKFLIPLVGCMLILQGVAETIRALIAWRTGRWPDRLSDVEELEVQILTKVAEERGEVADIPTAPRG